MTIKDIKTFYNEKDETYWIFEWKDAISFLKFLDEENKSLEKWKKTYNAIFNTLDLQLWE